MTRGSRNTSASASSDGTVASLATWCEDEFFRFCCATEEADGIHIFWDLKTLPIEEYPVAFEVYRAANLGDDSDIIKIAGPLHETWTALDESGGTYSGKLKYPTYRVKVLTAKQEHLSAPVHLFANLPPRKLTLARAMLRRAEINARHLVNWPGYLLKRKWAGESCSCRDPDTKDVYNSDCPNCFGTGFKSGYWKGAVSRSIQISTPLNVLPIFDKGLQLGNVTVAAIQAKIAGMPPITQYDAWIPTEHNYRFYITNVKVDAEFNAMPIICTVELRLAERNDILYSVPLE